MTKITSDAQALAVLHGLIHVFETALDDRSETCRSLHAYLVRRLASTSPAPFGYISEQSQKAMEQCRNDDHNGCVDIWLRSEGSLTVPLYTAAPQPVVEKDNG